MRPQALKRSRTRSTLIRRDRDPGARASFGFGKRREFAVEPALPRIGPTDCGQTGAKRDDLPNDKTLPGLQTTIDQAKAYRHRGMRLR
jgi:hypothetical protein